MPFIIYVTLIGLLSGVLGTMSGGFAVLFIRKIKDQFLCIVLGISAGIMTVIVFLDLIPEAQEVGTTFTSILGLILGIGLIAFLDLKFPHHHFSLQKNGNASYYKMGLLLSIGIALHNIPEGLAIGAGFIASDSLGYSLSILMALQNLPEGLAVATALGLSGMGGLKILGITALAGVPMGIGAFIGAYLGTISDNVLSISLGFAAGAMLYIVFDELIPDSHEKNEGHNAIIGIIGGVLIGIMITTLLHH